MIGDIVGRVEPRGNHWYELSDGAIVSFHIAYQDKERTQSCMFVSDNKTWPSEVAMRFGIPYVFMRNATLDEIMDFMAESGLEFKVIENA